LAQAFAVLKLVQMAKEVVPWYKVPA